MQYRKSAIAIVALAAMLAAATPASARWRGGHHWHGGGWGWGAGAAGFAAGAAIGSALAAPSYYYGGGPYYAYDPYDEGYAAAPGYSRDDQYCSQRYRSYDPSSGTYLGYDGVRHPCP